MTRPQDRPADNGRGTVTLELYLRSLGGGAARPRQEAAVERLEGLAEAGAIDGYTVVPWGDGISPSSAVSRTDAGRFILDRIDAFEAWADRVGVDVPFECRRSKASLVDEGCEEIVLPQMLLARRVDGELSDVVPFTDNGASYTVDDRLLAIQRDESWQWAAPPVKTAGGGSGPVLGFQE